MPNHLLALGENYFSCHKVALGEVIFFDAINQPLGVERSPDATLRVREKTALSFPSGKGFPDNHSDGKKTVSKGFSNVFLAFVDDFDRRKSTNFL